MTLAHYIDRILAAHPARARELAGGPEATKARAGDGTRRPPPAPFERVECDAHKLDASMVVLILSPYGGTEPSMIHRLRVVVLVEVVSRAVLGQHLSSRRECSADDVLRALRPHAVDSARPAIQRRQPTNRVRALVCDHKALTGDSLLGDGLFNRGKGFLR